MLTLNIIGIAFSGNFNFVEATTAGVMRILSFEIETYRVTPRFRIKGFGIVLDLSKISQKRKMSISYCEQFTRIIYKFVYRFVY